MRSSRPARKDVTIQVRLTVEAHKRWLAAARSDDRSLSNWIRRQCNAARQPPPANESTVLLIP